MGFPKKLDPDAIIELPIITAHSKQSQSVKSKIHPSAEIASEQLPEKSVETKKTAKIINKKVKKVEVEDRKTFTMRLDNTTYFELLEVASKSSIKEKKMLSVQNILERLAVDSIKKYKKGSAS